MAMKTKTTLLMPAVVTAFIVMVAPLSITVAQGQSENMTMEEETNATLAQDNATMEEETNALLAQDNATMEELTNALVGNVSGNMSSQNASYGNMTS
jgi:hypothetical protein